MKWKVPDGLLFTFYALPLFFFPLSTAGAGISAALFLLIYMASGYWREWRKIGQRPWAIPLALLIIWTIFGLLWTKDMSFGIKVTEATSYGVYAFIGSTLAWQEKWVKHLIRLFLYGIIINGVFSLLMTWSILPWKNTDNIPYTGFADHIFLSLILTHALLWTIWDLYYCWNFPRWANLFIGISLFSQLAITPGRSGQALLILLLPVAAWLLYKGRWRYWASIAVAGLVLGMLFIPSIQSHIAVGIHELEQFNLHQENVYSSWGIRLVAMIGGLQMFLAHPFFGVGTGDFYPTILTMQAHHEIPATPGFIMNTSANSFISEAAVLGIVGLSLFLWFLWELSKEAWQAKRLPQGWFSVTYIAIYIIGGLFDSLSWGYADAITIALIAGLPLYKEITPRPAQ